MIAIIDYGMGNIHSVQKAIEALGGRTQVVRTPEEVMAASKLVLPGVGAFDDAMAVLREKGLAQAITQCVRERKVFLGICLGMQLLFESSEEAQQEKGLAVVKGEVRKFDPGLGIKVPHMGWNQLSMRSSGCPMLKGVAEGAYVYFCHSYYCAPSDGSYTACRTSYGNDFTSVVWKDNLYGVQFHPEKSQEVGLAMLRNFIAL